MTIYLGVDDARHVAGVGDPATLPLTTTALLEALRDFGEQRGEAPDANLLEMLGAGQELLQATVALVERAGDVLLVPGDEQVVGEAARAMGLPCLDRELQADCGARVPAQRGRARRCSERAADPENDVRPVRLLAPRAVVARLLAESSGGLSGGSDVPVVAFPATGLVPALASVLAGTSLDVPDLGERLAEVFTRADRDLLLLEASVIDYRDAALRYLDRRLVVTSARRPDLVVPAPDVMMLLVLAERLARAGRSVELVLDDDEAVTAANRWVSAGLLPSGTMASSADADSTRDAAVVQPDVCHSSRCPRYRSQQPGVRWVVTAGSPRGGGGCRTGRAEPGSRR